MAAGVASTGRAQRAVQTIFGRLGLATRAQQGYSVLPQDAADNDGDDATLEIELEQLPTEEGSSAWADTASGGSGDAAAGGGDYWQMQQASSATTFFNLCNTSLGIGILSFALAVAVGRPLPVVVFASLTGVVACANSVVIVRSCVHYEQANFQGLVRAALGPRLERVSSAVMIAFSFATCAGYLMVIGDYASEVAHELSTVPDAQPECAWPAQWWCCRATMIWAAGLCLVLPLSLLPTVRSLSCASAGGVCSIGFTVGAVSYRGLGAPRARWDGWREAWRWPGNEDLLGTLRVAGIVIFAFAGQAQLPQIFAELQAPPLKNPVPGLACETKEQRQTARLLRMQWLLVLQYAFVTALCCVLGLAGFLCFGEDAGAAASVLQPFRLDDALINAARLAMVLVAAVSYPVIHFTARAMLHDLTLPAAGAAVLAAGGVPPPLSTQRRYALTMLFFGGTLALALLATDLGTLFTIFGSLCGWAVMFGVPACLLLDRGGPYQRKQADRTHVADRSVEVWAYVAGWVVAVGGGLVCVSCLALEFT